MLDIFTVEGVGDMYQPVFCLNDGRVAIFFY
jgi:hypothetical protein